MESDERETIVKLSIKFWVSGKKLSF